MNLVCLHLLVSALRSVRIPQKRCRLTNACSRLLCRIYLLITILPKQKDFHYGVLVALDTLYLLGVYVDVARRTYDCGPQAIRRSHARSNTLRLPITFEAGLLR
jgi:hypothetical protein